MAEVFLFLHDISFNELTIPQMYLVNLLTTKLANCILNYLHLEHLQHLNAAYTLTHWHIMQVIPSWQMSAECKL